MAVSRVPGETSANGATCQVTEYGPIGEADVAEAVINGRYPEQGFALNKESDMMIRVISGVGIVAVREAGYELHAGNVIHIGKQTPYYYEGKNLRVLMVCSPAWNPSQYEQID